MRSQGTPPPILVRLWGEAGKVPLICVKCDRIGRRRQHSRAATIQPSHQSGGRSGRRIGGGWRQAPPLPGQPVMALPGKMASMLVVSPSLALALLMSSVQAAMFVQVQATLSIGGTAEM